MDDKQSSKRLTFHSNLTSDQLNLHLNMRIIRTYKPSWGTNLCTSFAWFSPLMLSDIYRLWSAKLHIRCPINIFVAPGVVGYITAGRGETTVKFPCRYRGVWLQCNERNLTWIERQKHPPPMEWLASSLVCLHSLKPRWNVRTIKSI